MGDGNVMKEKHILLKEIIKESGLSQEEFGLRLGLAKARINHYCHGRRKISEELISSLMNIFYINPCFFFEENAPMYLDLNPEKKANITARQQKTINRYMLINNKQLIDELIDVIFESEGHKGENPIQNNISSIYKSNIPDSNLKNASE